MNKKSRLLFFLLAISMSFSAACENKAKKEQQEKDKKERAALTPALKSINKIKAATEVGVNYQEFGKLVIEAKAEANEALQKLPDGKSKSLLSDTIEDYADSLRAWRTKIENTGFVKMDNPTAKSLSQKYGLKPETTYGTEHFNPDTALQVIWAVAEKKLDQLNQRLKELENLPS